MLSRAIGVFTTMVVVAGVLFGGMYGCTPEKAAAGEVPATTYNKATGKHVSLLCRCNRSDGRGCVHWQCRRR